MCGLRAGVRKDVARELRGKGKRIEGSKKGENGGGGGKQGGG